MVSTTEIEPRQLRQEIAELLRDGVQGLRQCIGVLLTECMEMQSVEKLWQLRMRRDGSLPLCPCRA